MNNNMINLAAPLARPQGAHFGNSGSRYMFLATVPVCIYGYLC